jgi:bifunctional UDP-N-acetylglucosamine pyrophosphorylase / glucosamine-1-phosphate N-acetyltransferase
MALSIVILAAGQGKRMKSQTAKVLHRLAGKPLLEHVMTTASKLSPGTTPIIVYGHQGESVKHALAHLNAIWVEQTHPLGTGHALQQTLAHIPDQDQVLVLYGDVPLIATETLKKCLTHTPAHTIGIITAHFPDPTGLGRIIRDSQNKIIRIVEEKEASTSERILQEINSGIYLIPASFLKKWLPALSNQNTQQEYYLTDIIAIAAQEKMPIYSHEPCHYKEVLGINDKIQLAALERFYQHQLAEKLMHQGVTLLDPARVDVRGDLIVGTDVMIDINVIIEGNVKIGNFCTIGPHTLLRNVTLGDHVTIQANSIIDGAEIASHCVIGPFARIRPGTRLGEHVHLGNFVETKNSIIADAAKINHLTYIGDSEIGRHVNIGAGTITCNYDGVNKYKTIIGDHAFIGSNTSLVAPITIGKGATIGAGSTLTRDAPAEQLTLSRAKQHSLVWLRKTKKEKER